MQENKITIIPLISIILPVYNGEKYLSQAIESCLNQTHYNIELIIINDCSTDSTLTIANQYAEINDRIKIINNNENKKLPASLNIGHDHAKGDFITWTSDDNIYELNALEILLNEILKINADIVFSDFTLIDDFGNIIREVKLLGIENIIFGNTIGTCFLYKKEVYYKNKGYNENLFLVEDYDFWLRAILHSRYSHVKKCLYKYRKHEQSLTNLIASNTEHNKIWKENISEMYANFCKLFLVTNFDEISGFLSKQLTHQKIDFDWVVKNDDIITDFKAKLKRNINFFNGISIERVFMKKTVEIFTQEKDYKKNFSRAIFLISKYAVVFEKNTIKTLIKYSFFKWIIISK